MLVLRRTSKRLIRFAAPKAADAFEPIAPAERAFPKADPTA
jgi:hypothetical protein